MHFFALNEFVNPANKDKKITLQMHKYVTLTTSKINLFFYLKNLFDYDDNEYFY